MKISSPDITFGSNYSVDSIFNGLLNDLDNNPIIKEILPNEPTENIQRVFRAFLDGIAFVITQKEALLASSKINAQQLALKFMIGDHRINGNPVTVEGYLYDKNGNKYILIPKEIFLEYVRNIDGMVTAIHPADGTAYYCSREIHIGSIMAHEYTHHIQNLLGTFNPASTPPQNGTPEYLEQEHEAEAHKMLLAYLKSKGATFL